MERDRVRLITGAHTPPGEALSTGSGPLGVGDDTKSSRFAGGISEALRGGGRGLACGHTVSAAFHVLCDPGPSLLLFHCQAPPLLSSDRASLPQDTPLRLVHTGSLMELISGTDAGPWNTVGAQ